jgi:hypothetical protein
MSAPAEAPFLKRTPPLSPASGVEGLEMMDRGIVRHGSAAAEFSVDIRGRQARARVVEAPFCKRKNEVAA